MLVFRKKLMLKRLKEEQLLNRVDNKILKIMDELDGKEVYKNDWKALLYGELEYIAKTDDGKSYPINRMDVEEINRNLNKKERGCR